MALKFERLSVPLQSGSKITRFLEIQPLIASRRISLPQNGKHTSLCLEHCKKITANNTHRYDDIADTLYDAVKLGLIDQSISFNSTNNISEADTLVTDLAQPF